jgi:hypothetical protein
LTSSDLLHSLAANFFTSSVIILYSVSGNSPEATLLLKLWAAKSQYPSGWRLVKIEVGQDGELSFCLRKDKLPAQAFPRITSCRLLEPLPSQTRL